jgi:prepilin-type N-terminal cleavage/methylation domain-containing protein
MTRLRATRYGGQAGFSLVELLVALTICALVAATVGALIAPARAAVERTPVAIALQQRGRAALEAVAQVMRSAGANVTASQDLGVLADVVPAVILADYDEDANQFTRLSVVAPRLNAAQGTLAQDQDGPSGSLTLAPAGCPNVSDVCGFLQDMPAVIADGTGRFDIFVVELTQPFSRRITAATMFDRPYPAGSVVVEADALSFYLDDDVFVRETTAGAVQPVVDGVSAVFFRPVGIDFDALADGPWLQGPGGLFDDAWFGVRSVEITVRLPMGDGEREQDFHATVSLRNVR